MTAGCRRRATSGPTEDPAVRAHLRDRRPSGACADGWGTA
ncbi:hypothetical protein SAMN05660359_02150 [Geodermatophilus obscurus]|uniref:Uncharacterized protein n=1 Tax=Geodermatophilus obscurus TaxID=1861 RepID=A0A1I5FJY5_9ACTN|nr:hypothetical protein SAMN05660359_02150 [Geodermatophilus obscurus]